MFERFTERGRKVLSLGRQEAERLKSEFIGTEHILLGIVMEGGGVAAKVLLNLNIDLKRIRQEIGKLSKPSNLPKPNLGPLSFSPRAQRVIELASEAAGHLGHDAIGTEHLLLGLLKHNEGMAAQVLAGLGLRLDQARDMVLEVLGAESVDEPPASPRVRLEETILLKVGRREDYRHIIDRPALQEAVLNRLQAGGSVALLGGKYVGKTSLVIALARAGAEGIRYWSMDSRIFDEFSGVGFSRVPREPGACFVPEAELITASRMDCGEILAWHQKRGERLILEFREGGLDAFSSQFPDVAKDLVRIDVTAPDAAEARLLLESARSRLKDSTGYTVNDVVFHEAASLSSEQIPKMFPPFGAILALWKAVTIQKECLGLEEVRQLRQDIASLGHEKDEMISLQKFQEAAEKRDAQMQLTHRLERLIAETRDSAGSRLSIESLRWSIRILAGEDADSVNPSA